MKNYLAELKTVFRILPNKLNKRIKLLLIMLSIGGFLETLGIGLFIPIIAIIMEKKINFPFINSFYDLSNIEINEALFVMGVTIFLVYLCLNLKTNWLAYIILNHPFSEI